MIFNSYIFILLFLPLCLMGYFLFNRFRFYHAGLVFLLMMSLWFYGYFNLSYLPIICSSVIMNFGLYRWIHILALKVVERETGDVLFVKRIEKKRKIVFLIGIASNLGILGYFKYTDFFIENINVIFHIDYPLKHILLPLGISFFTFQQISFLADVYADRKGEISYSFLPYAAYVTYFPQLVAGPIVTHDLLVPQLQNEARKRVDYDYLSKGIALFTLGLAKKVLIADVLGNYVNLAYADVSKLNATTASLAVLGYTLQIYFDFSGYSDMAVGLGWMMHIDLPINFDSPYKSTSVTEFWKRWHMTLTAFFTKYVYIPLGGNRKGNARTYANILIVFLLSGLWHGAGWTYVLWGGIHGLAQMCERFIRQRGKRGTLGYVSKECGKLSATWMKLKPIFGWIGSFCFVNIAWVLFRGKTMAEVKTLLSKMWHFQFGAVGKDMVEVFTQPEWEILQSIFAAQFLKGHSYINLELYFAIALVLAIAFPNAKQLVEKCGRKRWTAFAIAFLLVWCIFSFTGISTFLYFNF